MNSFFFQNIISELGIGIAPRIFGSALIVFWRGQNALYIFSGGNILIVRLKLNFDYPSWRQPPDITGISCQIRLPDGANVANSGTMYWILDSIQ